MRRATGVDLDAAALLFDQYRQFYGQPSDLDRARAFLADRMANEESVILLATDGEETCGAASGFAQLFPSFTSVSTGRIWILNDLFVASSARGRGVARALMESVRRHAERTNAVRVELTTRFDNVAARRLYERVGYERDREFMTYRRAP